LDEVEDNVGVKVNTKFNPVFERNDGFVIILKNFEWRKFIDGWFTKRPNRK